MARNATQTAHKGAIYRRNMAGAPKSKILCFRLFPKPYYTSTNPIIKMNVSRGRTAANCGHPCGCGVGDVCPANAKTSPTVIRGHGVAAHACTFHTYRRVSADVTCGRAVFLAECTGWIRDRVLAVLATCVAWMCARLRLGLARLALPAA